MMSIIGANNQMVARAIRPLGRIPRQAPAGPASPACSGAPPILPSRPASAIPTTCSRWLPHPEGRLRLGAGAEKYTVRMGGCAHCPIRCHAQLQHPSLRSTAWIPTYPTPASAGPAPRHHVQGHQGFRRQLGADSSVVGNGIGTTMVDDLRRLVQLRPDRPRREVVLREGRLQARPARRGVRLDPLGQAAERRPPLPDRFLQPRGPQEGRTLAHRRRRSLDSQALGP
jgi:hypothetical protein